MEIINSNDAYYFTEMSRNEVMQEAMNNYVEAFNEEVRKATKKGRDFCLLPWSDFGVKIHPSDEDFANLAAFVEMLMDKDYEVEYYFHNPRHHDVSGIVVAWGPNANSRIDQFFAETEGCFYRGEEIGVH